MARSCLAVARSVLLPREISGRLTTLPRVHHTRRGVSTAREGVGESFTGGQLGDPF